MILIHCSYYQLTFLRESEVWVDNESLKMPLINKQQESHSLPHKLINVIGESCEARRTRNEGDRKGVETGRGKKERKRGREGGMQQKVWNLNGGEGEKERELNITYISHHKLALSM